jgi:NAD(P)-dependent dehydrogenase (short-subunit alcohol dehydrogenase family)
MAKVWLITGSGNGLGRDIAEAALAAGDSVVAGARRTEELAPLVAQYGERVKPVTLEVRDETAAKAAVQLALDAFGRLDVLVNNAGEAIRIPHTDLKAATPAVWRRMLDINLIAPFVLTAEAEPALRKSAESGRPASVVNIGTHAGVRPKGASIPYATAKAGLHHATRLLALALGPAIRVNCVAPGLVETPMGADWPEATALWNTKSAMRRPARPEDIADLVAALVANDYVTGEIVIADGGLNLT